MATSSAPFARTTTARSPRAASLATTVRCPWHHACFSLRTGEALARPRSIPLRAGASSSATRACSSARSCERDRRGNAVCRRAIAGARRHRRRGRGGQRRGGDAAARRASTAASRCSAPTMRCPYDRPNLSKDFLAGTAPEDWIPLRSAEFYAEQRIELLLGARVDAIDTAGATSCWLDGGRLAVRRAAARHRRAIRCASTFRARPAARALPAHARRQPRASSPRRSEAPERRWSSARASSVSRSAASLRERGLEVHVVAPASASARARDGTRARRLRAAHLHEEHGVKFHFGTSAASHRRARRDARRRRRGSTPTSS